VGTSTLFSLSWTPGGEIVYSSIEAGEAGVDLYVLNPDSGARRQLTFGRGAWDPAVSPDGRYVVFCSRRDGRWSLERINFDGTGLVKLADMPESQSLFMRPQVSSDSRSILYFDQSGPEGFPALKRISIDGGLPVIVKGSRKDDPRPWESGFGGGWSRRGNEIAFLHFAVTERDFLPVELVIASLDGSIRRRLPYTPDRKAFTWEHQKVQWSAQGPDRFLYFIRAGQVWKQATAGGPAVQVTDFHDGVFDFEWSLDGKRLACSLSTTVTDVVLITGFR
jgi:Tol biopolymer transport system component